MHTKVLRLPSRADFLLVPGSVACSISCEIWLVSFLSRTKIRARVLVALKQEDQVFGEKAILEIATDVAKYSTDLADWLEAAAPEITAHMEFPRKLWKRIRSNNLLERFNRELRRRERVVGIFPNKKSALRLISALAAEKDDEWRSAKRYLDPELLEKIQIRKAS
jgi:putative transposase